MNAKAIVQAAWKSRAPLLWVQAPDTLEATDTIARWVAEARNGGKSDIAIWSAVRGWQPGRQDPPALNPVDAIVECIDSGVRRRLWLGNRLGEGLGGDVPFAAALQQARRALAQVESMLVCVVPYGVLPPSSLASDFLSISLELPGDEELAQIAGQTIQGAWDVFNKDGKVALTSEQILASIRPHLRGLTRFGAEQIAAAAAVESLLRGELSAEVAIEARRQILRSAGLQVVPVDTMPLPGLEGLTDWVRRFPANIVCWIDEIEKSLAGARGDLSGVSQDQLGVLLNMMQEKQMLGLLLVGPPGTGKSEVAKQAGRVLGVPVVQLDLGALKGSLVGESEMRIRRALTTVSSIGRVLMIATSNGLDSVPPELRRRFTLGTWFVDLPDAEARARVWRVWLDKTGLQGDEQKLAEMTEEWAPADIATVCRLSAMTGAPLEETLGRITPTGITSRELRQKLQAAANGRWMSAATGRLYQLSGSSFRSA